MCQYKASTFSQLIFYHFQVSRALSVKLCDKETKKVYFKEKSAELPGDIKEIALRKLRMTNNAQKIHDFKNTTGESVLCGRKCFGFT